MQPDQDYLMSAACSKLFSTLFYKKPCKEILDIFKENDFEATWPNYSNKQKKELEIFRESVENENIDLIKNDFFKLFIGSEKKLAYPWGSVYTDKDNLIFGASSIDFAKFCKKINVSVEMKFMEPLDHIGIIFSVLSVLFERASMDYCLNDISELLKEHLLPWFNRFVFLMQNSAETNFYKSISVLVEQYINYWVEELEVDFQQIHLYK